MKKTLVLALALTSTTALCADTGPTSVFTVKPCRVVDTRVAPGTPIAAGAIFEAVIRNECEIPHNATAVFYSITAVNPSGDGYLTVYGEPVFNPSTSTYEPPLAATLTYKAGTSVTTTGALAEMLTGELHDLHVFAAYASTHIVIDVTGFTAYATIELIQGTIADIQGGCPSTGACFSELIFEDGSSVFCAPPHIDPAVCAVYAIGDCVRAAGHILVLGGEPEVFAGAIGTCPEPVP